MQAGTATINGRVSSACVWTGTADSIVDLHAFLPDGYARSEAYGIGGTDNAVYVVGYAYNPVEGRPEAMLWTLYTGPACQADLAEPYGTLNFFDVASFLNAYNGQDAGGRLRRAVGRLELLRCRGIPRPVQRGLPVRSINRPAIRAVMQARSPDRGSAVLVR
jgi:hypothetical protein